MRGRTLLPFHGIGPFEIHVAEGQEMEFRKPVSSAAKAGADAPASFFRNDP